MEGEGGIGADALDFGAAYGEGRFIPGLVEEGIPWDIGGPQPGVVGIERSGGLSGHVLDVGCGLGENAFFLASRGYAVTAVDAEEKAIERARVNAGGSGVRFEVADATSLAGFEDRFDSVLDSALFHCLDQAGREKYVRAVYRVARPGARFHILCFAEVPGGMPAPLAVSAADLRATLEGAGWRVGTLERTDYLAGATAMRGIVAECGLQAEVNAAGLIKLPAWKVDAIRE